MTYIYEWHCVTCGDSGRVQQEYPSISITHTCPGPR